MEQTLATGKSSKANAISITLISFGVFLIILGISDIVQTGRVRDDAAGPLVVGIFFTIISVILFLILNRSEIVVTDKRVYGKAAFGIRVDLPVDMISSVGMGIFESISVSTSSGNIRFFHIINRNEIYNVVAQMLLNRQEAKSNYSQQPTIIRETPVSNPDEIRKYKELLDSGIISQEEFDAKKKQLLGL